MLLTFKAKNYKSFKGKLLFSMTPAPKQKGLDYSIQKAKIGNKTYKGLSTAIIYGPNASGKTNIIGAMDTLRSIILRGNIRNVETKAPNQASLSLEMIPFCHDAAGLPVEFSVKFIESGVVIDYFLSLDLGAFLNKSHERTILKETLSINDVDIFIRSQSLKIYNLDAVESYLNDSISENSEIAESIAQSGLNPCELFLTGGFKNIFSKRLAELIVQWFEKKLMVFYRADSMRIAGSFDDSTDEKIYIDKTLNDAASAFGINSNALGFITTKDDNESELYSIFTTENRTAVIPAEIFESFGTIRFINEFPLVIRALLTGATLVVDEFDASIHPMALMNIINAFHNDEINKMHAQLIFNTHNPIFLNSDLFRRDEIKFVERDDETHESSHYSLADFKTSGANGVRKGEDYMKNYFISQYGAIKDIDFSPILEALTVKRGDNEDE